MDLKRIPKIKIAPKPKKIWKTPCKHCPSAYSPPDPEALDFEKAVKTGELSAKEVVFACAWRPQKLCRGICDKLNYP